MQNINPTTKTIARDSGETVKLTEWTIDAYTLRKIEEADYTDWIVRCADRTRPRVENIAGFGQTVEFGISCSSISDLSVEGAAAYAAQIAEAADTASKFNEIVAAD